MLHFVVDRNFKSNFKEVCVQNHGELVRELQLVFDLPLGHYLHSVLNLFLKKYPKVCLDKNSAKDALVLFFGTGSFYIADYDEPFYGGYANSTTIISPEGNIPKDHQIGETIGRNWRSFVQESKSAYWENHENKSKFLSLSGFAFFEDRPPSSPREKALASNNKIFVDGVFKEVTYKFFNTNNVAQYFTALVSKFYPEFELIKGLSNKKIKRFGKAISNNVYLGFYIDFGRLESELKMGYLELPAIKIEIFSKSLNGNIKEDSYLRGNEGSSIARINIGYFMGNPMDFRMGNSSENEDVLKKELFYFFDIYSFYLKTYLRTIENNLSQIFSFES